MTFDEVLAQVLDLLQRQGRVSYRALKRRFALDERKASPSTPQTSAVRWCSAQATTWVLPAEPMPQ